jgi:alpha-tubulin suppressor-like RCC1 family protein
MKGLLKATLALCLGHIAFAGTPITTNSFVRHDIAFSATPMDFAVGAWNTNGDTLIAAVTHIFSSPNTNAAQNKVEFVPIGTNAEPSGPFVLYSAPNATGPIAISDIDGDGANDIVFGAGSNLVVRLNTSSASAPAFATETNFTVGEPSIARGLAIVDLDHDGKNDVVYGVGPIYALRNQSTAGTVSFAAPMMIHTNAVSFVVADLDGDNLPDLEVKPSSDIVRYAHLLNASSPGTIAFVEKSFRPTGGYLVDVNADAKPDRLSIFSRLSSPFTPRGEPDTELSIATNSSLPGTVAFARAVSVQLDAPAPDLPFKYRSSLPAFRPDFVSADFNLDGRTDLMWVNYTNFVVFLENLNVAPLYVTSWGNSIQLPAPAYPYEPIVADMNADGKPDVAVGSGSRFVSIFENRIVPIPELVVNLPQPVIETGAPVELRAAAYAADVSAVEFFEDGNIVGAATAANGFRASYVATNAGLHRITARATAGGNVGLVSKAAGLRVVDANLGQVVAFGDGAASSTTILIYDSGRAFGVGSNVRGQLGDQFFDAPHAGFVELPRPNAAHWKGLSAGGAFTVGLTTDGRVFSWGANDFGQLGRMTAGTTNPISGELFFRTNTIIEKIGAGREFSVALDANGDLFAWGSNLSGQLGKGDNTARVTPSKIKKPEGVARWKDVSVGMLHVLALDEAGQLFGWGWNVWGQAGQPRTNFSVLEPMKIDLPPGETAWTNIHAGVVTSYAQTASGRTYRWGDYYEDEGEVVDHVPRLLEDPEGSGGFRLVRAGAPLNAALGIDGNAYVWGGGILAPSGLGDDTAVTNPTRLPLPPGVTGWKAITVAARRAAALANDGRVFVWGFDLSNALATGTVAANVPTEPCMPMQNCASNYPPAVKIVHPAYGDVYPADDNLRFEIAADDFDGVVETVKIFQQTESWFSPTPRPVEVARLNFGETTAQIAAPTPATLGVSYIPIAYDNSGMVRTGAALRLLFPNRTTSTPLTLTNTAPTNELTGWRETMVSFRNNSSFSFGAVSAIWSNIPPGVTIRNDIFPSGAGVETIVNRFGVRPGETTTFRIEYKLADDVSGARLSARFVPGAKNGVGQSTGEVQPLTMTILTNGFRLLEFEHSLGEQHVVQFSQTLTNWIDAAGFMDEERDGKMLWLDGGPPATPKLPAEADRRFYRVLRRP